MKKWILCTIALGLLYQGLAQTEDSGRFSYRGYVKFLQSASYLYGEELITNQLFHNRMNIRYQLDSAWELRWEIRNRLFYGEELKLNPAYGKLVDRYDGLLDLSVLWVDNSELLLHSIIDRAYVNYSSERWNLRLGRQRINWGVNTVWNPNDLFNAYNFLDFDYEERPGSDALRIQHFMGINQSLEFAYAPGKTMDQSVMAAKWGWNSGGYDLQVLGGYYKDRYTLGVGWAGNIRQAGFKGEMGYFYDKDREQAGLSASATVDYIFSKGFYLLGSFLYNGNAEGNLSLSQGSLSGTELSPANLFPSPWTFLVQGSEQVHPLLSVNVSLIYASESNLSLLLPSLSYSIKENWDLDLVSQNYFLTLGNRYQALGTAIFFRLKWSH